MSVTHFTKRADVSSGFTMGLSNSFLKILKVGGASLMNDFSSLEEKIFLFYIHQIKISFMGFEF